MSNANIPGYYLYDEFSKVIRHGKKSIFEDDFKQALIYCRRKEKDLLFEDAKKMADASLSVCQSCNKCF